MTSCLGSHKLEVWTVPYQHPDADHHSSKNLHSAFLDGAEQGWKLQCRGAHRLDGQAQQRFSGSAHAGHLEKRRKHLLKGTWYLGRNPEKRTTPIKIAMMRLKTGEMLIVATSRIRIKSAPLGHRNAIFLLENARLGIGRYPYNRPSQIGDVDEHFSHRILPRVQNRPLGCSHKTAKA